MNFPNEPGQVELEIGWKKSHVAPFFCLQVDLFLKFASLLLFEVYVTIKMDKKRKKRLVSVILLVPMSLGFGSHIRGAEATEPHGSRNNEGHLSPLRKIQSGLIKNHSA